MNDKKNQKKQSSPLYQVSYFVGSQESHQFNLTSVSIALLFVIARYASMSSDGICKAHHEKIMKDARIKNTTSYGNHLRILQRANLIKSNKNWKLSRHKLGDYFVKLMSHLDNESPSQTAESTTYNVAEKESMTSSTTANVSDQQRLPLSTIENKKKESIKVNNTILIDLNKKERKILYEKKGINMAKNNYSQEYDQYVKFFYNNENGGFDVYGTRKKLSTTQAYVNKRRFNYNEACRREALLRDHYGAEYVERNNISILDHGTFSIFGS